MTDNIYVSTSVLEDGLEADVAVRKLMDAGFNRIEIGSTHVFAENYSDRIAAIKKLGFFVIHNYFPPADRPLVLNLASTSKAILESSIRQIKAALTFVIGSA